MNWISTIAPWQWMLLSGVPIGILLLYFLKLRREPVEVPSTFLWSRTIEDLHVNSLLQRLRRSLLLFLQLMAVLLAAIALLRPGTRGEKELEDRVVFLLDTSASMNATDVEGAATRFELARKQIGERIEQMSDEETAMLITFSDRPDTAESFTSDRRRLREALASVEVTHHPTDILGALKAADGLANPRRTSEVGDVNDLQVADAKPAALWIFSDGGFQPINEFSLGNLVPHYVAIGSDHPQNIAIIAFSAERNLEHPAEVQAYATIANLGTEAVESSATLSIVDSKGQEAFLDASRLSLDPGEQTGLTFAIESDEAVQLKLELDLKDDLQLDNQAFAGLAPMRSVHVLVVTPGNHPLELGLRTAKAASICRSEFVTPDYLQSKSYLARAESGQDDLMIFDRCSPSTMPATNTFFIGSLPPSTRSAKAGQPSADVAATDVESVAKIEEPNEETGLDTGWKWLTDPSGVMLIDVDRTHPLMHYLELYSLLISSGRSIDGPTGSIELLGADVGPMLVLSPRDGYQDLVLGFEIISSSTGDGSATNTNWFAERSWPVFLLNVLRYLAGAAEANSVPSYQPGETVRLRLENSIQSVNLTRMGDKRGEERSGEWKPGPSGVIELVETDQVGNYQIKEQDRLVDQFVINLFDRGESHLAVAPVVEVGYVEVDAEQTTVQQRKEYWRWLLLGALGMIAAEWFVYSRRVG